MLKYRKLKKYKYQLMETIKIEFDDIEFDLNQKYAIVPDFITLKNNKITVYKGYAWDGASGPAIDTKNFMKPSLIHDALYQLIELGVIDKKESRKKADMVLKQLCLKEGMSKFRATYVYWAVRMFGGFCLKKSKSKIKVYEV